MVCSASSFAQRIGCRPCRAHSPSNKLLALAELGSNTWVSEVKRIRGKRQPLPEGHQAGLLRVQFQSVFLESPEEHRIHFLRVFLRFEAEDIHFTRCAMHRLQMQTNASWAERPGRNPYEKSLKSCS